jgi:hypothetical protein
MAKMYTTSKTNPITGDPVNNSSFPGSTGSKREERKNAAGKLTGRQNRALNQGVEKQKSKIQYKGTPVEEKSSTPKTKDWRDKAKADKGGKKGVVVKGGKGGRVNINKMDASCKKPK